MLNKGSFIKFMHIAGSVRETRADANHSTPQLIENWNNSQVSYHIDISNLQTQHILASQSCSCVAKRNNTVMVIITLKNFVMAIITLTTVLIAKVSCHFCQVILLF